jgi:ABC-type antimicrobial peptide transport system permease subunit
MRPPLQADTATQHRAAAAFALGFAAAAITSLAGVLALDVASRRLLPTFALELVPDATWTAPWLPGAVTAARQQQAAADQWLHVILVFAVMTVAIACINALIGLWSHGNERRYETAVRAIVGASPRQLGRSLLRNALLNAGVGALVGVPVGLIAAFAMRGMWEMNATVQTTTSAWAMLAIGLCVAVGVLAAHVTSARFKRPGWLGDALAPDARTVPGWGAEDLRELLAGAQLASAVALTTVSLLAWGAQSEQRGTEKAQRYSVYVARVSLPESLSPTERHHAYASILASASAANGVVAESIASPGALLGLGKIDKVISECGRCARAHMLMPIFPLETQHHVVSAGFFGTAGIAVTRGREFDANEPDPHNVIVNDTFARLAFQQQDPIGKRIRVGGFEGDWYRVIGTVADVRITGLQFLEPDPAAVVAPVVPGRAPAIYFSSATYAPATVDLVVRSRGERVALAGFDFQPLTRVLERAGAPQKSFARVLTLLGLLLGGAAAIGTFTTTMLNVKSRREEIAVRRAVGARRRDVWRLVYASVARTAARGAIAGVMVSAALARVLEIFIPGLPTFDLGIAVAVGGAFVAVALLAALLPVREALRA